MQRREATGWILKSAIFSPALIGAIQSCQQKISETNELLVLNQHQYQLCNAIADTIIPETDTPSASQAKVVTFIDLLLQDVYEQEVVDSFIKGLEQFDQECEAAMGKSFNELTSEQQAEYLAPVDQQVLSETYHDQVPFYYTFKRLCITVYFSSEQGIKQNLNYTPVPGPYQGDVGMNPGDKIAVGNRI